jgi:hypothetical protein
VNAAKRIRNALEDAIYFGPAPGYPDIFEAGIAALARLEAVVEAAEQVASDLGHTLECPYDASVPGDCICGAIRLRSALDAVKAGA